MGESLNDLNYEQLEELNENVDNSLKLIRERKVNYNQGFFDNANQFNYQTKVSNLFFLFNKSF